MCNLRGLSKSYYFDFERGHYKLKLLKYEAFHKKNTKDNSLWLFR